ncbi:LysE/ArgO family amino acid transporter [Actinomyces ruminis]|uniref:LysE/ArgO family amino acid transporter n=1 Tax=Actinomyces ruminis TaxID=1937003 RepID=UPI00211F382A|nr:LysE family transporter [Actinomyces ruminis]
MAIPAPVMSLNAFSSLMASSAPAASVLVAAPPAVSAAVSGLAPAVTGFATGLGLIVAIGAQNAWVLRQGVRRQHIGLVIAICALSDLLLIVIGTGGIGVVTRLAPWVPEVLRWGGVFYLIGFAVSSFRSAMRPGALEQDQARAASSVALTTVALTWLNPHVYLDTVLMLGTVTNGFGEARWVAAAGAGTASVVWFTALGLGARTLSGPLSSAHLAGTGRAGRPGHAGRGPQPGPGLLKAAAVLTETGASTASRPALITRRDRQMRRAMAGAAGREETFGASFRPQRATYIASGGSTSVCAGTFAIPTGQVMPLGPWLQ